MSTRAAAAAAVAVALLGGGVGTVRAATSRPAAPVPDPQVATAAPSALAVPGLVRPRTVPPDTLEDATPAQRRCITRNAGTQRARISSWHRPEPRYKVFRAVLDAAYRRAIGDRYYYGAPVEGVPFGLLGHGLDERSGRVILLVDPSLIDPVPFARHLDAVAARANVRYALPAGERITVAVQPGCFTAKQVEALRDRMRAVEYPRGEVVERVGRDVEFDGRLHVLVHVDDRAQGEALRRREGPLLAIYWTTERPPGWEGHLEWKRTYRAPALPKDDLSDATPEQRACLTRDDGLRKANEAYAGWGDDRRQRVAETLTRAAYKAAVGGLDDNRRLRSGLFGYDFDEAHNRVVFQVDPGTLDAPAFTRTMQAAARRANRSWNVPPGHDVRILVQPSCFTTAQMLALRERMAALRDPGPVEGVSDFIRWDGRMHIVVALDKRAAGEEIRRREGPIVAIAWVRRGDLGGTPLTRTTAPGSAWPGGPVRAGILLR